MIHADRTFGAKGLDAEDELVEVMAHHKWALCQAFEYDGLLYLNDGDREDSPEYAALKIDEVDGLMVKGREVGRIRPLGMDPGQVRQFVQDTRQGRWSMESPIRLKVEPEWHHSCELCEFKED
ncbi:MAG TPA: hypothetical protein VLY86_02470 [Methanothrix sp.]|nr:hypothetical protein [Methanothrix sp.]